MIRAGGQTTTDNHAQARIAVCEVCQHYGQVQPIPGLVMPGCLICGCPSLTKAHMKTYFSISKLGLRVSECPHPDGNKWQAVDQIFSNN